MADSELILLVDNIPDHVGHYRDVLQQHSFRVEVASNGSSGLMMARALDPDCVVIDIRLPDMTGWELCRELKRGERTCRVPVLVLTPDTSREFAAESTRVECNAWIAQPTVADDLVRAVQHVLEQNGDPPRTFDEALLGVTACPACGSDRVRATLRVSPVQYYACRACGYSWRVETL